MQHGILQHYDSGVKWIRNRGMRDFYRNASVRLLLPSIKYFLPVFLHEQIPKEEDSNNYQALVGFTFIYRTIAHSRVQNSLLPLRPARMVTEM